MRLNAKAFGLACGVVVGLGGFLATLLSMWFGAGYTIQGLAAVYPWYSWSFVGALLACLWGLIYGLIFGWIFATVYNAMAGGRTG